ncbi:MAG: hypothetical protein ABI743_02835 [bacterium]
MRVSLVTLSLALSIFAVIGCPAKAKAEDPKPATPAPAATPETPVAPAKTPTADDQAALNAKAVENFAAIEQAIIGHKEVAKTYPQMILELRDTTLEGKNFTNPFNNLPLEEDHSFLGTEAGFFSFSPITMADGKNVGFIVLGYGDTGDVGADQTVEDTFFKARNWIGYNNAATNPRLPNDVPDKAVFAAFHLDDGVGKDPPADYEAPVRESLTGE